MEISMEGLELFEIIILILVVSLFIFLIFYVIYLEASKIIHKSYHDGYNEAKNTDISYYSVLYTLKKEFKELKTLIERLELSLPIIVFNKFDDFTRMLDKYQSIDFKKS